MAWPWSSAPRYWFAIVAYHPTGGHEWLTGSPSLMSDATATEWRLNAQELYWNSIVVLWKYDNGWRQV